MRRPTLSLSCLLLATTACCPQIELTPAAEVERAFARARRAKSRTCDLVAVAGKPAAYFAASMQSWIDAYNDERGRFGVQAGSEYRLLPTACAFSVGPTHVMLIGTPQEVDHMKDLMDQLQEAVQDADTGTPR